MCRVFCTVIRVRQPDQGFFDLLARPRWFPGGHGRDKALRMVQEGDRLGQYKLGGGL